MEFLLPYNTQSSVETIKDGAYAESNQDQTNSFLFMPQPRVGSSNILRQDRTPSNLTLKDSMDPENRNYSIGTLTEEDKETTAMVTTTQYPSQQQLTKV